MPDGSAAAPASKLDPIVRAGLWMLGSLLTFALMAVSGRELSREVSTFQVLVFRSMVGLPVTIALILYFNRSLFRTRHIGTHLVRNSSHFCGQWGWFYGISTIPLAEVFAIEFTAPVWTTVFAMLILGERFTFARGIAVLMGFIGAIIILRPGASVIHPAALVVLGASFLYAFAHTYTKKLSGLDRPLTILFYMMLIQLALGLWPALSRWVTPSPHLWPWILSIGLTALIAQYCLTRALALADAIVVMPMDFLRMPLIAVVGLVAYGEYVSPWVFIGAAVIVAGLLYSLQAERRRTAPAPQ